MAEEMIENAESAERMRERLRDAAAPIVERLSELANDAVREREPIERRWIEDMCQFAGVRSISELRGPTSDKDTIESGGSGPANKSALSRVFINITQPKTNRFEGRLFDILFPADDKNWSIRPTPVPELETATKGMRHAEAAIDELNRLAEAPEDEMSPDGLSRGELLSKASDLGTAAAEAQRVLDEAKGRCSLMEAEITDDFVQASYAVKARDAIGWACKLGVGILKGPVLVDSGKRQWLRQDAGSFALNMEGGDTRPSVECISPWSFFPDPYATCMQDCEYVFERHLPSKRELRRMAKKLGFYPDAVARVLESEPGSGSEKDMEHLQNIRLLTGETTRVKDRYILWEYHGPLTVQEIASFMRLRGDEASMAAAAEYEANADPLDDRMVIAHFCNNHLLKISEYYPMDSGDFLYSVFSLEKGQASVLGAVGIPRKMRDPQMMLNSAVRMMMDNAALSVGPQILVNRKAVKPMPGDDWTMRPRKMWDVDLDNAGGLDPFQVFNVRMNQEQLAGIIMLAKQFIDDEIAMPSIIEGGVSDDRAPGAASTMGGFAMLLNAAGVEVRRTVKNWDDDITDGLITRFYDWHMQHSEKEEIKGDMQVDALGTGVLLARETQAPNLMAIAQNWTVHPVLGSMVKAHETASATLRSVSISPDCLETKEDWKKKLAQIAEQEGGAEDPQWSIRLQIAQIESQTRLDVATLEHEREMMQLASNEHISLEEINAKILAMREANAAKERQTAAEIGADTRRAREVEAKGMIPEGSGGVFSAGVEAA